MAATILELFFSSARYVYYTCHISFLVLPFLDSNGWAGGIGSLSNHFHTLRNTGSSEEQLAYILIIILLLPRQPCIVFAVSNPVQWSLLVIGRFRSLLLNCGTNCPVTSPLPFLWLLFVVSWKLFCFVYPIRIHHLYYWAFRSCSFRIIICITLTLSQL